MFEDSLNLAENKLILLYIFHKVNLPISNIQLSQIVLENSFMNYFTLQQYVIELLDSNLLTKLNHKGKDRLSITQSGEKVLTLFQNRISEEKLEDLNMYIKNKFASIKKELTVTSDYTIENNNSYVVNLVASENDIVLMDLKISVATNKQARDLCHKWKSNSSDLYNKIIHLLLED